MEVIRYPGDHRPASWTRTVLALGNFDACIAVTTRSSTACAAVRSTSAEPRRCSRSTRIRRAVVRPDKAPRLLMTTDQKLGRLADAGMDGAAVVRFTPELSRWDPEEFARRVLVEWLSVAEVWVGANFLFGRDRSGNFSLLRSLGARYGFRVEKISPVRYKDFVVSSTRIRRLVDSGEVDEAGALLGHHYYIDGEVQRAPGAGARRSCRRPTCARATRSFHPTGCMPPR